ncbi:MAG: hypothetical protein JWM31_3210 [Solirubrobacterales bacterium]|nr:hypothetical protein [Solirubrobacterales bacterium]
MHRELEADTCVTVAFGELDGEVLEGHLVLRARACFRRPGPEAVKNIVVS